ncbi:MAG: heavy metal sensor histidine kinase [Sulfuriferula sp.]
MILQRSITLRLALLFALATMLLLAGIGYFLNRSVESHLADMDWGEIHGKWELTQNLIEEIHTPADLAAFPQLLEGALVGHPELFVMVKDQTGKPLYATPGFSFPQQFVARNLNVPPSFSAMATWHDGEHMFRGAVATIASNLAGHPRFTVEIALENDEHQHFLDHFHRLLLTALLFGMTAAGALGWFIARRGLLPVRDMAAVARNISVTHLSERLRLDSVPMELRDLAMAFNGMLSRLEDSFHRLTDFSSDIAHELRTPINNLMVQSQVALSQARNTEQYQDVIASNLEEFDRLARMIADMLFLAKADNGLMVAGREQVDLETEIEHLAEFFGPFAEDRGVTISTSGRGTVTGDRIMLQRAIANLLSNAIAHTAPGGQVQIRLINESAALLRVEVENPGKAIPVEQLGRIFDRFYRLDPARGTAPDGVGLGLAITKSIVVAHKGYIAVFSDNNATVFTITLLVTL